MQDINEMEQPTDRSHYTYDSLSSEEDEEDKELALEVENAIAAVTNSDHRPAVVPIIEPEENELLQRCANDIAALRQTTGAVAINVNVDYKPLELKFSDEIFLQELSKPAPAQKSPINLAQSLENLEPKKELAKNTEENPPPQTAVPKSRKLDEEKKKKEIEMKRLMEEIHMMEEDELSRRIELEDARRKFDPYAKPLSKCEIFEYMKKLSVPLTIPPIQKLGTSDPDEGFLKYSIQGPVKITPKMVQELFVVKPKPKQEPEVVEFFKKPFTGKIAPPPEILSTAGFSEVKISVTETVVFTKVPQKTCQCWADVVIKDMITYMSKAKPCSVPRFDAFLCDTFYRINPHNQTTKKKADKPNNKNPDSEAQQMAELSALCEEDELNLLDTLPENAEEIEIKLSPHIDLKPLSKFLQAKKLSLPMNQLTSLGPVRDLFHLRELYVAQNKIARLDPTAFQKLEELRVLHADINLLEKIEGLDKCRKLEVLKLDNNRIRSIGGLSKCLQLRTLNLYRNQISEVAGLESLNNLQCLDLGRNKLKNVDYLGDPFIVPMISELLLYYNEIEMFPADFSKPMLRSLWLNGNKLQCLSLGYCPLLEMLTASDNSIISLGSFTVAPLLHTLDVSFNNIKDMVTLFSSFKNCRSLKSVKFNDNPVMKGREGSFNTFLMKLLPFVCEINSESVQPLASNAQSENTNTCLNRELIQRLTEYTKIVLAEQAFIGRILKSGKFKIMNSWLTFLKENPHTQYYLRFASAIHYNNLLKVQKTPNLEYLLFNDTASLYANSVRNTKKEREAAMKILSLYLRKRTERRIKLRKYKKHETKIVKIQAWIRGAQTRKLYKEVFGKLSTKRRKKKPVAEQMAVKIQAVTRGYLFRKRIKKGLENAKKKKADLDECPEIDVDDFLGMKTTGLEDDFLMVPDHEQLKAIIEKIKVPKNERLPPVPSTHLPEINKAPSPAVRKNIPKPSCTEHLPELSALNKKNLGRLPNPNRDPTGSEISEYELQTESQRSTLYRQTNETGGRRAMEEVKQRVNNFVPHEKDLGQHKEIREKSKKLAEDWGIKGEDSKKVVEAWIGKMVKRKQKKQVLTPEERFQRFLANKPPASTSGKSKVIPKQQNINAIKRLFHLFVFGSPIIIIIITIFVGKEVWASSSLWVF
eukprot:TRINITY_DN718_c0_g1_i2.p1 TRINITY_DN718_c0_g1~~TRINITY_DN718_c0_g1_i2.p1  ORF type:complete len:1152 (-),score=156.17 TRINITY_DN718_c0_g1_i2:4948-8403(-)